jgi:hypothetical protein
MRHEFEILRRVEASAANVIANYLDFEHTVYHADFERVRILSQTEYAACIETVLHKGPFRLVNIGYGEYRPPNVIFSVQKTVVGPIRNLVTVNEERAGDGTVRCTIRSRVLLDLPWPLWPLRRFIERRIRRTADALFEEDRSILERRQRLMGSGIEDYLRPEQPLMAKEAFARTWRRRGVKSRHSTSRLDPPPGGRLRFRLGRG